MGRTLLIPAPEVSVQEWVDSERKKRPLVMLDPGDATRVPAARLHRFGVEHPEETTFFGSLNPERAPHVILAAQARLQTEDCFLQTFAYRPTPLMRQTLQLIAEVAQPERIVIAEGAELSLDGWPVGPEVIAFPAALPESIRRAQRKAQWLRMIERAESHEVSFAHLSVQGMRLGSGTVIRPETWASANLPPVFHAEVCGGTLLVIAEQEFEDRDIARALDLAHAQRMASAHPSDFADLLCAFVREGGEEFGFGRIEAVDFKARVVHASTDAVPPVPVRILKVGSLRVDKNGNEQGELRNWQL
jgi:hypothetical protein